MNGFRPHTMKGIVFKAEMLCVITDSKTFCMKMSMLSFKYRGEHYELGSNKYFGLWEVAPD